MRAKVAERSEPCWTCLWDSSWAHHVQGLQNDACGAKRCARNRELRCGLNLSPGLADLKQLSSLVAEGLADSVVVDAFPSLRVLIPASVEAAVHTEQACVVG